MLKALIEGKLSREQENLEDLLTSNVFGTFSYLRPELGLIPFLGQATTSTGLPLRDLFADGTDVKYDFWPWLPKQVEMPGCEPDVLLRLTNEGTPTAIILVEAKYLSGKSSFEDAESTHPTDQLAREWRQLCHLGDQDSSLELVLLYVTADFSPPVSDMEEAKDELQRKVPALMEQRPFRCEWVSWRELSVIFAGRAEPILVDLVNLAERLDLFQFDGITEFRPTVCQYRFNDCVVFDWAVDVALSIVWEYES